MTPTATIGEPFRCEELPAAEVLASVGAYTACVNDPPWSGVATALPPATRVVVAGDMELAHLDSLADQPDDSEVVVGFGGGTALDTAKFLAWRQGKRLVQIPTITSVDAGFTDAVGVRVGGRVRYVGNVVPELVALDLDLICAAPKSLNRAGIGDILSCLTGMFDWRLAAAAGHGQPLDEPLLALGEQLLDELEASTGDIRATAPDGVRFLADAYRRIGAACAAAGHSRFEEGSEHFWAYSYEHTTGAHPVHGEIVSLGVCALAHVQDNDAQRAFDIVSAAGTRAHPSDLGVDERVFTDCLVGLAAYSRSEGLDVAVADLRPITTDDAARAWEFVSRLPCAGGD
jgi:glycerol dehydrogenase-like iron-containing ADH family enzyme